MREIIFFCHIPKAGGQTLTQYFDRFIKRQACLRIWDPRFGADCSIEQFKELDKNTIINLSAVYGHIPVKHFLANPSARELFETQRIHLVTSVRDPLDRILSLYNYIRQNVKHPQHASVRSVSFKDFALNQPGNQQVSFLSSEQETIFQLTSRQNVSVVALQDSIDFFAGLFEREYGQYWRPGRRNVTELKTDFPIVNRAELDPILVQELRERHTEDLALYLLASKQ